MDIPVYLFTGFLESGKTTVIRETLLDPNFTDGEKTLLIACEEGLEEYDDEFLSKTNTIVRYFDKMSDLTAQLFDDLDMELAPDRVLIEFNGTWNVTDFLNIDLPLDWVLVQIVSTVNADTFALYSQNGDMKQMIFNQLKNSELIIFNRCDEKTDKRFLRTNVKAINRGAQLVYENKDGSINDLSEEELPFDLSAPLLKIEDDDFGLWYMDAIDHPDKYAGHTVQVKGMAVSAVKDDRNAIILGRYAMVCCAQDTSLIAILVRNVDRSKMKQNDWIVATGKLHMEFDPQSQENYVVMKADTVESCEPMEDAYVYFS